MFCVNRNVEREIETCSCSLKLLARCLRLSKKFINLASSALCEGAVFALLYDAIKIFLETPSPFNILKIFTTSRETRSSLSHPRAFSIQQFASIKLLVCIKHYS